MSADLFARLPRDATAGQLLAQARELLDDRPKIGETIEGVAQRLITAQWLIAEADFKRVAAVTDPGRPLRIGPGALYGADEASAKVAADYRRKVADAEVAHRAGRVVIEAAVAWYRDEDRARVENVLVDAVGAYLEATQ